VRVTTADPLVALNQLAETTPVNTFTWNGQRSNRCS
jgi:hypothetical protein